MTPNPTRGHPARRTLRIAALEPYAAGSHLRFLEALARSSRHEVQILSLPARAWKWRMRTAALHFARELVEHEPYDLLFVSDYLSLAELVALLPPERRVPAVVYFHENQLTYPLQPGEARDHHFALSHLYSGLCAARVLFNSDYHRDTFLAALQTLLRHVPDVDTAPSFAAFRDRSEVLPLGIDLVGAETSERRGRAEVPTLLWNHRWEYDKDPEAFVSAVEALADEGLPFRLRVLGQRFRKVPAALERLRERLGDRLDRCGFVESRRDYEAELCASDLIASTARHEFFGLGTLEALSFGCLPVLPHDLAYPELLPADLRRAPYLYARAAGPERGLRDALSAWQDRAQRKAARIAIADHLESFSWTRLGPRYDQLFEGLVDDPGSRSSG